MDDTAIPSIEVWVPGTRAAGRVATVTLPIDRDDLPAAAV